MKLLAFDTAIAACSAAVYDGATGKILSSALAPMERGQAEALAPMLRSVMAEAGLRFSELDRIAVTVGPGSFTGVRIGLAMARGLGLALNLPVTGIDSLSAIAANEKSRPLLIAADARNNEVYAALIGEASELLLSPSILKVEECARLLPQGPATIIGTAAETVIKAAHRDDLTRSAAKNFPIAANFASLAAASPASQTMPSPLYLRAPDAKPQAAVKLALHIRKVSSEAAALLASLHAQCFETPWTDVDFHKLLGMPGAMAFLALAGEEPVGFLLARRAADEAEIIIVATRLQFQRRGVARALLQALSAKLAAQGISSLFIEVATSNAAARALYESDAFKIAGTRKNYYQRQGGGREDALIMRKQLAI